MKKLCAFLCIICVFNACSESDSSSDDSQDGEASDVPHVRSFVTYIGENTVTLNGFIDNSNNFYQGSDTYKIGFIFREGDENDSSNDQNIIVDANVEYQAAMRRFETDITGLTPNTTYYYTSYAINGDNEKYDWEEFNTSEIPCSMAQNNYVNIAGNWQNVSPEITDPNCCDEGNVGIRFGNWPNIYEINFNELDNGYPVTGQYFGVDYEFDITYITRELIKSTNQVLIGSRSIPETELFVINDGVTLTLIFCDTQLRNDNSISGKVSVTIP